jgi:selenocysteine lyase/cysteine desulfurase
MFHARIRHLLLQKAGDTGRLGEVVCAICDRSGRHPGDAIQRKGGSMVRAESTSSRHTDDEKFWANIRAAYPEQQPLLNLNNAAVSPPPLVVEQATIDAYRFISRNPDVNMWSTLDAALPATKRELAALADCSSDEIALNRNSSEGLSTAIFGIPLSAGDEVLISPWDYPSVRAAWLQRQYREGIKVVTVDFYVMDDDDIVVKAYEQAITSRTRVMQLTLLDQHFGKWRAAHR